MKHIAKGLASFGRGEDSMLVHMTPKEVAGLQQLAVASGGSLTINPHTGLPEAGWLSNLLPMLAGGIATVMTGGAAAPWMAPLVGGITGGGAAALQGKNPLMGAGLGALGGMGGSGLAKGLMGAGKTVGATVPAGFEGLMAPQAAAIPAAPAEALKAGASSLVNPGGLTPGALWKGLTMPEKLGLGTTAVGTLSAMSGAGKGMKPKDERPFYYQAGDVSIDPVTGRTTIAPGQWSHEYDFANLGTYRPGRAPLASIASPEEEERMRKQRGGYAAGGSTDQFDFYKNLAAAPVNSFEFQKYLSGD